MSNVLFLPGCTFEVFEKDISTKVFDYLTTIYEKAVYYKICCGSISEVFDFEDNLTKVDTYLHQKIIDENIDLIIVQCANCYNYYKNNCKDEFISNKVISIYEVLNENMVMTKDYQQKKVNVHDSCQARACPEVYYTIRELLFKMNFDVIDIKYSKNLTKCCGNGAMVGYTSQRMKRKLVKQRQSEFTYDIVTYCSHCQRTLKNAYHILNLIFKD